MSRTAARTPTLPGKSRSENSEENLTLDLLVGRPHAKAGVRPRVIPQWVSPAKLLELPPFQQPSRAISTCCWPQ